MTNGATMIPAFVVIPLAGAFVNALLGKRFGALPELLGSLAPLLLLGLSLLALQDTASGSTLLYPVGGWNPPVGIALVLDGLTAFMLVTVNLVALAVSVYARDYMARYTSRELFYTLLLLMVAGMNGVIVAGDLFNLYVFLEIAAVASYALVAFGTGRHELEAAFKYAVMGTVGSLFVLLGIVLLYGRTSTLNMADMSLVLSGHQDDQLILMVSVLFLMGFGLKAALIPFHAWLPDAHPSAPAPISAMLSGVLIKSLGIYALFRIFYTVLGMSPMVSSILMFLGTLSMVLGVLLAMGQEDIKRLLAYSSISQVGYVVLGISLGTPLGILGGLFHLFNHSVFKALLFLNSGALEYATGNRDLHQMGGVARKMPVTGATNFVAALSIAGIPPFSGFWSKLVIIVAAVQAGHTGYALWAVIVAVLTLALFARVLKHTFFSDLHARWQGVREVPGFMRFSMIGLALLCLAGGFLLLPEIRAGFLQQATAVITDSIQHAELTGELSYR